MIAGPPLLVGAVQATDTEEFPAVAVPMIGGFGTTRVTAVDAADEGPVLTTFVAATSNS